MRGSHSRLLSVPRLNPNSGTETIWIAQGRRLRAELLFIRDLSKGTNEPIWALMARLRQPNSNKPKLLAHALHENGVMLREFEMYRQAVQATDIDQAIAAIREVVPPAPTTNMNINATHADYFDDELDLHDHDPNALRHRRLPPWLVVYLASHKARTPAQAERALLDLVFTQIPHVPAQTQPSLLVLTALPLAKYALLAPLRRVLDAFLTIPVAHPALHFNLLLQAVARLPKSPAAADLAVQLLETMTTRGLRLWARTYHILLADRFVTLQLTKRLRARMGEQQFPPSAAHLEAYVRVFAKGGAIHDAGRYMEAIRTHETQRGAPNVPHAPTLDDEDGSPHRANTKYMRVFGEDRASAFDYLARLIGRQTNAKPSPSPAPVPPRAHLPAKRPGKNVVDVFDWTTTFSSAARDLTTSSSRLLAIFDRTLDSTLFPPTVATYTVLLRGLIRRGSYADAALVWDRLIQDRLVLDRKTIGAGVKALTLAGDPAKAFRVLEAFGAHPGAPAASPALVRRGPRLWKRMSAPMEPLQRVRLDTMALNDFMVALLRVQRPDMVFRLWDHMEELYGVKPDSHSLDTLCRAARLAVKMDENTLRGNMAIMGLSNPFRRVQAEPVTREQVVRVMHVGLAERNTRIVRSIWKGAPAFDGVREAFRGVIFGNWPEMRNVRAPAHAVRRPDREDGPFAPLREVAQSIAQSLSASTSSNPDSEGQPQPAREPPPHISFLASPHQASVVPSETTFQAYILLLGTSDHQHEIPLVLAWMRTLQVKPSQRTLCFALIFWAEVSLRGPLFEDWAERNERSEYGRLVQWIRDWVGDRKVPTDGIVAGYLKEVAEARDSRAPLTKRRKRSGDAED